MLRMEVLIAVILLRIGCIAFAAASTAADAYYVPATPSSQRVFLYDSSSNTGTRRKEELNLPTASASVATWQQNITDFLTSNCSTGIISVVAAEHNMLPLGKSMTSVLISTRRTAWYEETLASLVMEYCEEVLQSRHRRYVTVDNVTAAKDEHGTCIQAIDGDQDVYAAGMCEGSANCYWEAPREDSARNRRYTDEMYADNESAARDYMQGLMLRYGTLGFLLAIAVFVGSVKFTVSRGIFNKCVCDGDLQRERMGYTTMEQNAPAAIFVAGFLVVAAAGFLAVQGNSNVSTGLNGMISTTDRAIEDIHVLISSVFSPLSSFVNSLNASAEEVEMLISTTDVWLGGLEDGLLLRLEAFDNAHRNRFQGRGAEFDALAAGVEDAGAAFVSDVVARLSAAMDVLQADFLDKQSLMEGQSHNVLAALTVLNGTAAGLHDHLEYFRAMSDEYLGVRTNGLLALVAFATAAGALGLLGVTAGLTESKTFAPCINCLRLTCIVTAITTWTAFILSSLLIVGVVAWSDGCHFLELAATRGWEQAGLDGQSAAVLGGCFRGRPVIEELNLTEALGFFESYADAVEEVGALDVISAATEVETAIYAISDFIDSLNSTTIAVTLLDFYTFPTANGSLLLAPNCSYNVSFGGDAIEFLDRPWLALPTATTDVVAVDDDGDGDGGDDDGDDSSGGSRSNATNITTSSVLTPWEAGGTRQSFGRQGDESASTYISRIFNSSDCTSLNHDLLKAWKFAARTRAIRDQMAEDLTCTMTTTTATTPSGGNDTDSSTTTTYTDVTEECPSNATSSSSSSSLITISSSSSSVYPFPPCPCTSSSYAATNSLLFYFSTFANNVDNLRAELSGLLSLPESLDGRGSLANSSEHVTLASCASRCSFLSSDYANFEGAICGRALSGTAQVGFALFLLAIGGLALAVTSGVMVHRLKANWARNLAKVLSTEEGIVMEEY